MKAIDSNEVEAGLVARVARDAARRFGLDGPPQLSAAWRIVNPYSIVLCLEYRRNDWRQRFFAKLARNPLTPKDQLGALLQVEFDVLRRLQPLTGGTRPVGTVEPLGLYLDIPSLVTVEARGLTLRKAYARRARWWSGRQASASLVDLATQCGVWLASFHDQTAQGPGRFDVDELIGYCQVRLDRLGTSHPGLLTVDQIDAIRGAAQALSRRLPADGVRICGRHNDFASHNIIAVGDGGLSVLDFMSFDRGPEAFDACNFWFELELLKFDRSYRTALLAQMQQAFLRGYGRIDPDRADFRLARLRYTINRLLNELSGDRGLHRLSLRRRQCIHGARQWLLAFGADNP